MDARDEIKLTDEEEWEELTEADVDGMDLDEIHEFLPRARAAYAALDSREPSDIDSDEYGDWLERLEILDALLDDISDRLDELQRG